MIKEIIVGVGKCSKMQVKILSSTSDERREKFLNDMKADYKNVFKVDTDGNRKVIKGCEELDINEVEVDINEIWYWWIYRFILWQ